MIERILGLMEKKNIKANKLCRDLELSESSITDWKKGKAVPSVKALEKIAKYFGVSLDWLIAGEESKQPLDDEDTEILLLFKRLNALGKSNLLGYANGILTNEKFLR
ncbi:MAG: helix-turn-helix transcriptional regulator [Bacillota bacterium]|nr:helix-turn-helix transcriptional regulator [Bacillota bacterium]